jgi:metal-responsive CopG/Arc/MetJ family transcriptional regulator
MAETNEELKQVNVQMPVELVGKLDAMIVDDESDRSKFVRRLIRQEWGRRQQMALPLQAAPARKSRREAMPA